MILKTFPVGAFQCNCTIIGDETTGEAIVVDPGDDADRILKELNRHNLKLKYLLHTHAHLDHIGATKVVKTKAGGTIGLHKDDLFLYENIAMQGEFLGIQLDPVVAPIDHYLVHNDKIEWGDKQRIEVIHTPGHTPGSLSFVAKNLVNGTDLVFAGDTLFSGSIGRTDLWGGDYNQIINSIKTRVLTLPDQVTVVCGHGPNTTIGQERKFNPFLN